MPGRYAARWKWVASGATGRAPTSSTTQQCLAGMSDEPGHGRQRDPMLRLLDAAHRAQSGQDAGMNYLTVPF